MKIIITKNIILKTFLAAILFWLIDFLLHVHGVGETNYYYTIKLANALLFSFIWFSVFDAKKHLHKFYFSVFYGTWISFYYLITAYSGLVQFFGIYARYTAPPFVILGIFLPSFFWWLCHIIAFYLGIEIASRVFMKKK